MYLYVHVTCAGTRREERRRREAGEVERKTEKESGEDIHTDREKCKMKEEREGQRKRLGETKNLNHRIAIATPPNTGRSALITNSGASSSL